jgi:hypothetical protein
MVILRSSISALTRVFVFTNFEYNAGAPDQAIDHLLVYADNEAGDNAGWQDGISVFKGGNAVEGQLGFAFGEQIRYKEGFGGFDLFKTFAIAISFY